MSLTLAPSTLVETWYTPESEIDSEKPFRALIKPLNQNDMMKIFSDPENGKTGQFIAQINSRNLAISKGVVGWENVDNEDGTPVKFSVVEMVNRLPAPMQIEISNEIIEMSIMTAQEKKA